MKNQQVSGPWACVYTSAKCSDCILIVKWSSGNGALASVLFWWTFWKSVGPNQVSTWLCQWGCIIISYLSQLSSIKFYYIGLVFVLKEWWTRILEPRYNNSANGEEMWFQWLLVVSWLFVPGRLVWLFQKPVFGIFWYFNTVNSL